MSADATADSSHEDAFPSGLERVSAGYRLGRVLGRGGMGVVIEASNVWTGRKVAIKFLSGDQTIDQPRITLPADRVDRFVREARVAASLGHPNVVDVLDMGQWSDQGVLFIAYEFLEGGTLREMLAREHRLAREECYRWLVPTMEALEAAHQKSVFHRDFKPENVMFARAADGSLTPKVIDFGIAKARDENDASVTRTGTSLGTARYMSPEQARDARSVDGRCDVWAVGAVWFEALSGSSPYPDGNYNEVIAALLTRDPPSLREVAPEIAPALASVIDRALRREPQQRWATMRDFIDALDACRDADDQPVKYVSSWRTLKRARLSALLVGSMVVAISLFYAGYLRIHATAHPPSVLAFPIGAPGLVSTRVEPTVATEVTSAPPIVQDVLVPMQTPLALSAETAPRRNPIHHSNARTETHHGSGTSVGVGPVNGAPVLEP